MKNLLKPPVIKPNPNNRKQHTSLGLEGQNSSSKLAIVPNHSIDPPDLEDKRREQLMSPN